MDNKAPEPSDERRAWLKSLRPGDEVIVFVERDESPPRVVKLGACKYFPDRPMLDEDSLDENGRYETRTSWRKGWVGELTPESRANVVIMQRTHVMRNQFFNLYGSCDTDVLKSRSALHNPTLEVLEAAEKLFALLEVPHDKKKF